VVVDDSRSTRSKEEREEREKKKREKNSAAPQKHTHQQKYGKKMRELVNV
jgi:hypothetical protein